MTAAAAAAATAQFHPSRGSRRCFEEEEKSGLGG